ncbi:MAG TPA: aminotransferase [Methylotenera mobilis]|uniref:Aminotransferase n=1 Tax=Methylotenera mobilis TaxID=359408 RepID=A0A351RCG3_9PROT|nr:aminotransferase [Methylotenera mobilis]
MLNHPLLSPWPFYEADEVAAATQTLISGRVNYWTGELGKLFEVEYAKSVGKKHGIALSNGTVALELALRVLDIKAGDEVIVTSRSYVASASCVLLVGATPVFADVDFDSGNISVESIASLITDKTKAIIPVHIGGRPCDMVAIMALANQHHLKVIEDCAQAHGAVVAGKPVGAWGHASIFSFCQDKIISTGGEGGMLLLEDTDAYKSAWAYKDIGRSYDAVFQKDHPAGFRWLTESAGSNFRMTEFQAAIGLKQLAKLPDWISKRNHHANVLINVLSQFKFLDVPAFDDVEGNLNAYYRVYIKIKSGFDQLVFNNKSLRDFVISQMEEEGVPCFSGACSEVYKEKLFEEQGLAPEQRLPNANYYTDQALCFLVHHTITDQEMTVIVSKMNVVLSRIKSLIDTK